jgi:hypothetical protein
MRTRTRTGKLVMKRRLSVGNQQGNSLGSIAQLKSVIEPNKIQSRNQGNGEPAACCAEVVGFFFVITKAFADWACVMLDQCQKHCGIRYPVTCDFLSFCSRHRTA